MNLSNRSSMHGLKIPYLWIFRLWIILVVVDCAWAANPEIYFKKNSTSIESSYLVDLDKIGRQLVKDPDLRLQLTGYSGDESNFPLEQQRKLSLVRSLTVRNYLVSTWGVSAERISLAGRGYDEDQHPSQTGGARVQISFQGSVVAVEGFTARGESQAGEKLDAPRPMPLAAPPVSPTNVTSAQQAREALGFRAGDTDVQKTLKDILTSRGATYNLVKKGHSELQYGLRYAYFGTDRVEVEFTPIPDGSGGTVETISLFDVVTDSQNSFRNSLRLTYGLRDDLNLEFTLPLVMKSDPIRDLDKTGIGDLLLGMSWQPYAKHARFPTLNFFSDMQFATGTSPFEIDLERELSTGEGLDVLTFGASLSKILDPVALFATVSWSNRFDQSGLNQLADTRTIPLTLTDVNPGGVLGVVMGIGYALSYEVNLAFQMGLRYGQETDVIFIGEDPVTGPFTSTNQLQETMSAVFSTVVGFRVTPKTLVNIDVGIGLTADSPDLNIGFSIPIQTEGWGDKLWPF